MELKQGTINNKFWSYYHEYRENDYGWRSQTQDIDFQREKAELEEAK